MTGMNDHLASYIARLGAVQSVGQAWDETVAFERSLGFELIEYGYAAAREGTAEMQPDPAEIEVVTLSNFPAAYRERYRRERYSRDDPVVRHCVGSLSPRPVGRDAVAPWPGGLTILQRRIVDEAAECGMTVGVAIPLRSPGRYPLAGISLSNAMRPTEFKRLWAEWGEVAHLAALYAHTRVQMLLQTRADTGPTVVLSARERECLRWVSRGLSSRNMAARLGLSPKTVDFHVANAMSKLGVATRGQAVLHAVTLGLLEPP